MVVGVEKKTKRDIHQESLKEYENIISNLMRRVERKYCSGFM